MGAAKKNAAPKCLHFSRVLALLDNYETKHDCTTACAASNGV